jgi:hypothetical protein
MPEKPDLKKKLEKLSLKKLDESEVDKPESILKTKKPGDIGKPKNDVVVQKPEISKEAQPPEKDSVIPKPEIEKRTLKNFEIPPDKLKGVSGLSPFYDESGDKRMSQILFLKYIPEAEPQWTVMKDPSAEEFALILRDGLKQFKTQPLIYGMEFDEGVIVVSHKDGYTMSLACYELKIGKMLEIFISLLEYIDSE